MSDVLRSKTVHTRKPHVCFGCGREFPKGTMMESQGVKDGGTVFTCYLCDTCNDITNRMSFGDDYGFGDLRDEAEEEENMRRELPREKGDIGGEIHRARYKRRGAH
jgi:hypothetical protein